MSPSERGRGAPPPEPQPKPADARHPEAAAEHHAPATVAEAVVALRHHRYRTARENGLPFKMGFDAHRGHKLIEHKERMALLKALGEPEKRVQQMEKSLRVFNRADMQEKGWEDTLAKHLANLEPGENKAALDRYLKAVKELRLASVNYHANAQDYRLSYQEEAAARWQKARADWEKAADFPPAAGPTKILNKLKARAAERIQYTQNLLDAVAGCDRAQMQITINFKNKNKNLLDRTSCDQQPINVEFKTKDRWPLWPEEEAFLKAKDTEERQKEALADIFRLGKQVVFVQEFKTPSDRNFTVAYTYHQEDPQTRKRQPKKTYLGLVNGTITAVTEGEKGGARMIGVEVTDAFSGKKFFFPEAEELDSLMAGEKTLADQTLPNIFRRESRTQHQPGLVGRVGAAIRLRSKETPAELLERLQEETSEEVAEEPETAILPSSDEAAKEARRRLKKSFPALAKAETEMIEASLDEAIARQLNLARGGSWEDIDYDRMVNELAKIAIDHYRRQFPRTGQPAPPELTDAQIADWEKRLRQWEGVRGTFGQKITEYETNRLQKQAQERRREFAVAEARGRIIDMLEAAQIKLQEAQINFLERLIARIVKQKSKERGLAMALREADYDQIIYRVVAALGPRVKEQAAAWRKIFDQYSKTVDNYLEGDVKEYLRDQFPSEHPDRLITEKELMQRFGFSAPQRLAQLIAELERLYLIQPTDTRGQYYVFTPEEQTAKEEGAAEAKRAAGPKIKLGTTGAARGHTTGATGPGGPKRPTPPGERHRGPAAVADTMAGAPPGEAAPRIIVGGGLDEPGAKFVTEMRGGPPPSGLESKPPSAATEREGPALRPLLPPDEGLPPAAPTPAAAPARAAFPGEVSLGIGAPPAAVAEPPRAAPPAAEDPALRAAAEELISKYKEREKLIPDSKEKLEALRLALDKAAAAVPLSGKEPAGVGEEAAAPVPPLPEAIPAPLSATEEPPVVFSSTMAHDIRAYEAATGAPLPERLTVILPRVELEVTDEDIAEVVAELPPPPPRPTAPVEAVQIEEETPIGFSKAVKSLFDYLIHEFKTQPTREEFCRAVLERVSRTPGNREKFAAAIERFIIQRNEAVYNYLKEQLKDTFGGILNLPDRLQQIVDDIRRPPTPEAPPEAAEGGDIEFDWGADEGETTEEAETAAAEPAALNEAPLAPAASRTETPAETGASIAALTEAFDRFGQDRDFAALASALNQLSDQDRLTPPVIAALQGKLYGGAAPEAEQGASAQLLIIELAKHALSKRSPRPYRAVLELLRATTDPALRQATISRVVELTAKQRRLAPLLNEALQSPDQHLRRLLLAESSVLRARRLAEIVIAYQGTRPGAGDFADERLAGPLSELDKLQIKLNQTTGVAAATLEQFAEAKQALEEQVELIRPIFAAMKATDLVIDVFQAHRGEAPEEARPAIRAALRERLASLLHKADRRDFSRLYNLLLATTTSDLRNDPRRYAQLRLEAMGITGEEQFREFQKLLPKAAELEK
ncbi:MAG: hypothetical protein HYV42_01900 [Candidatus Magasanikbacteria bacterium]|nr:hypothetical protein [Candidatus Magasanikbacteria bacterium]